VAPEWGLVTANRSLPLGMTHDEARRGIHVGHDLVLHRPIRAGEELTVQAHVTAVGRRTAGATQEMLFVATATGGEVVWRTRFSSLLLGVGLDGEPTSSAFDWPASPAEPAGDAPVATRRSFVRTVDAHVYSECARIWNPIHTDVVAARAAGLSAPILHGTATLARSVSIVTELAGARLGDVRRVAARFAAMVAPGSSIDVRLLSRDSGSLAFDVLDEGGRRVLSGGLLELAE
jgi:acyl dehydratase